MKATPVSLIIVSQNRPAALQRCLTGVAQMDHPAFEVIVVAGPAGVAVARGLGGPMKIARYDAANISVARNIGLGLAAGEVVAFIDDDAVPEPSWLSRLAAPFADREVVAATGFVRGRNGISLQWRACEVDATGQDHALAVDPAAVSLHRGSGRRAVKTVGTNCAFRRAALLAVGGFDPSYHFYLDEADANLRLAAQGLTAVVPLAQVHHGYGASAQRRSDRVPLTLFDIGASSMIFLRRHAGPGDWTAALTRLRADQRRRVLGHMVAGRIEPREVACLMATLEAGLAEGRQRPLTALAELVPGDAPFLPLAGTGPRAGRLIAGRFWQAARLRAEAEAAVARGEIVTLLRLSPTALYHRHSFQPEGYWLQTGGLFGRSGRAEPLLRLTRFRNRVADETRRLAALRPVAADTARGY